MSTVGAQVRAGGPLQYPTIASMYLEVVFAFGLGLLLCRARRRTPRRASPLLFVALALIAEAIMLTFTRAGLITMAASLVLVGGGIGDAQGGRRDRRSLAGLAGLDRAARARLAIGAVDVAAADERRAGVVVSRAVDGATPSRRCRPAASAVPDRGHQHRPADVGLARDAADPALVSLAARPTAIGS